MSILKTALFGLFVLLSLSLIAQPQGPRTNVGKYYEVGDTLMLPTGEYGLCEEGEEHFSLTGVTIAVNEPLQVVVYTYYEEERGRRWYLVRDGPSEGLDRLLIYYPRSE